MDPEVRPIRHRNRAKQVFPLRARLLLAAQSARDAARAAQTEFERQELLRRARRFEVTAGFDQWLSAPGLTPPE